MASSHDGHRERLRVRAQKEGLLHFQPHEVLELLLYYSISRIDVNPLAHRLIDAFGSVDAVLSAPKEELMKFDGMGERTVNWLHSVHDTLDAYQALRLRDRPYIFSQFRSTEFLQAFFVGRAENQCWLFCSNISGYFLHCERLSGGARWCGPDVQRRAVMISVMYHAYGVLLATYRPRASLYPTHYDITHTRLIQADLKKLSIPLFDHVFIGEGDKCVSMRYDRYMGNEAIQPDFERSSLDEAQPFMDLSDDSDDIIVDNPDQ